MRYLTAYCFGAVQWEVVPGTAYEKAILGKVDTAAPGYQLFERQLYERVLERMGFEGILAPETLRQAELDQQAAPQVPGMTMT